MTFCYDDVLLNSGSDRSELYNRIVDVQLNKYTAMKAQKLKVKTIK